MRPDDNRRGLARSEPWLGPDSMLRLEIGGQAFAIGVTAARDVLPTPAMTPLPRAPRGVAGGLNLRGRAVVVIDPRVTLGLSTASGTPPMLVVVAHGPAFYALLADRVTEVADLPGELFAPVPATLPPGWAALCEGVFRMPERLVVVLSVARLLDAVAG